MTMGLEPKWTDLSDMLATRTDDQLLKWKEVAENPRVDDYRTITTLRQLVVDLYNKSIKDIINELSIAVNDVLNSRSKGINMDKKLEARIARLEKLLSHKPVKNESANAELESMSNDVRDYLADNSDYFSYDDDVKVTSYEFIISTDNEITRRDFSAINQLKSDLENYLHSIGYDFDKVSFDIDPNDKYGIIVTIK